MALINLFKSWNEDPVETVAPPAAPLTPEQKWQEIFTAAQALPDPSRSNTAKIFNALDDEDDNSLYIMATACLHSHLESNVGKIEFKISGEFLDRFSDRFGNKIKSADAQNPSFAELIRDSIAALPDDSKLANETKKKSEYLTATANREVHRDNEGDFAESMIKTYIGKGDLFLDKLDHLVSDDIHLAPTIWKGIKADWSEGKRTYHPDNVKHIFHIIDFAENNGQAKEDYKAVIDDMVTQIAFPEKGVTYGLSGTPTHVVTNKLVDILKNKPMCDDFVMDTMMVATQKAISQPDENKNNQEALFKSLLDFWSMGTANRKKYAPDVYLFAAQVEVLNQKHSYHGLGEKAQRLLNQKEQEIPSILIQSLFDENQDDVQSRKLEKVEKLLLYRKLGALVK